MGDANRLSVVTTGSSKGSEWHCHCCTAKNDSTATKCRVCGRPESYAMSGYPLPFHGKNATLYRPSQILNVLDDIHEVDSEKWTSLHAACAAGNLEIVRTLISYKSQLEAVNNKGQTAIHMAVFSGSDEIVQALIRAGANVNATTWHERVTPLHMACEQGYGRMTQMLMHAGANIHATNLLERTPLHCAAISGRTDIALLLINAGANIHALDAHGWEPCQIAELFEHRDFQEFLIRHGMEEKQAVIKDLPPAKWHSDIWFEVVKMQSTRRSDYQRLCEQNRQEEERIAAMKATAQAEIRRKRMEERKALIIRPKY